MSRVLIRWSLMAEYLWSAWMVYNTGTWFPYGRLPPSLLALLREFYNTETRRRPLQ